MLINNNSEVNNIHTLYLLDQFRYIVRRIKSINNYIYVLNKDTVNYKIKII